MRKRLWPTLLALSLAAALLALAGLALDRNSAQAAGYTVTVDEDANDGACDAHCSLREAIIAANATADMDTVYLPAGVYSLILTGSDTGAALGDLDIRAPLMLIGEGAAVTIIDATRLDHRVFNVFPDAVAVTIIGVSITHGRLSGETGGGINCDSAAVMLEDVVLAYNDAGNGDGGGLFARGCDLTINQTQVISNTADQGGGMYLRDGTLHLNHSRVAQNASLGAGAGIRGLNNAIWVDYSHLVDNVTGHSGGALYQASPSSTLQMAHSLVSGNLAEVEGAGLFLAEGLWATIDNSTISGNRTNGYAGGLNVRIPVTITHSTITGNVADDDTTGNEHGGGLMAYTGDAQVYLQHTLIAGNLSRSDPTRNDCYRWGAGTVASLGYNLVETVGNCTIASPGDITGQAPRLGPLQDNGGASWTHALLPGSPALDAGDPAVTLLTGYDQRGPGYARLVNGRVDIGAYEAWLQVYLPVTLRR
jgi:CSLREA domain-containing protein